MFVRWKKRTSEVDRHQYTLSAYLVKSERVDGKPNPKQKVLAFLGSLESKKLSEKQPSWWVRVEKKLQPLNLDDNAREHVLQALAQKTPRPSEEEMVEERKTRAGWDAFFASRNVEPDEPPLVTEACGTTEKELMEKTGLKIQWDRKGPYQNPITGRQRERWYYLALARCGINGKYEVVAKFGHIPASVLKPSRYGDWPRFWFGVHRALCLADVDLDTYETTMQLIGCRVTPPKREEFAQLIHEQHKKADNEAWKQWQASIDVAHRWDEESKRLETVQKRSMKYIDRVVYEKHANGG